MPLVDFSPQRCASKIAGGSEIIGSTSSSPSFLLVDGLVCEVNPLHCFLGIFILAEKFLEESLCLFSTEMVIWAVWIRAKALSNVWYTDTNQRGKILPISISDSFMVGNFYGLQAFSV